MIVNSRCAWRSAIFESSRPLVPRLIRTPRRSCGVLGTGRAGGRHLAKLSRKYEKQWGTAVMHASTGSERTTAAVAVRDIARVLIVADEPQAGAELGAVLVEAGFEVLGHAVDWCEAVAVATQVRPDLIVMAAGLPD